MATSLLVLTDFNPAAHRALAYADSLAGAIDARLVVLHVRRDSVLDPALFTGQLSHRSQQQVDAALTRAVRDLTAPVVTETAHGQVAAAVADALIRHPSALIVLGRPDEESIPDELISTAALDLLRADPHPMLIVPHNAPTTSPPHRVLLAIDAEPFTLTEFNEVVRHFFSALHARLTVVHVSPTADEAAASAAFEAVTQLAFTDDLRQLQTINPINLRAADGILEAAATGKFDLIILIARPRSFLGELFHRSVTAEVLLHSPLPVLVLPAKSS